MHGLAPRLYDRLLASTDTHVRACVDGLAARGAADPAAFLAQAGRVGGNGVSGWRRGGRMGPAGGAPPSPVRPTVAPETR